MAHVDLDSNNTLDFQVRGAVPCWLQSRCIHVCMAAQSRSKA